MDGIRHLTKRERLEWYLNYLRQLKSEINDEIEITKNELKLIKKEEEK